MGILVIYIISLFSYIFFVGHSVVLGGVFAAPYEWLDESDDYNSDEENFLYLMKIILGVCTLACAIYYGGKIYIIFNPVRMMVLLLLL